MRHHFGLHPNADAQMLLAGLLKLLRGSVVLSEADFLYPHQHVAVMRRVSYSPYYRVRLWLVMHDGYKALTGGDPGRHKALTILGPGSKVHRTPIPATAVGHLFGSDLTRDYTMVLAAMLRRLGGSVTLKEADFPDADGAGKPLMRTELQQPPLPLKISLELTRRGNFDQVTTIAAPIFAQGAA